MNMLRITRYRENLVSMAGNDLFYTCLHLATWMLGWMQCTVPHTLWQGLKARAYCNTCALVERRENIDELYLGGPTVGRVTLEGGTVKRSHMRFG